MFVMCCVQCSMSVSAVYGCVVSMRNIHVCNCDMFSVVNVYLGHFNLCVVCINGQMNICCSECNLVSNECTESTSWHVQPIGAHGGELM